MTATSKTGAASGAGAAAYANYLTGQTLNVGQNLAADYYYGSGLRLRPDLSPAFAAALGIKASQQNLEVGEIANLMNLRRADGGEIEGKKQHRAHQSVAEVFGLAADALPTEAQIENVLAGRRAGGSPPRGPSTQGKPRNRTEELGQAVHRGERSFSEALDQLVREEIRQPEMERKIAPIASLPPARSDLEHWAREVARGFAVAAELERDQVGGFLEIEERVGSKLLDAIAAAEREMIGDRPTTDLDTEAIEEGLSKGLSKAAARADLAENGRLLSEKRIISSQRQFKTAIGVPTDRAATPDEIARLAAGKINVADYFKQITATSPPTAFVDITLSADKTVSVSFALAETQTERDLWQGIVAGAAADTMVYVQETLGVARRGAGGLGESEPAELAWFSVQHFTARPAVDVVRIGADGNPFTDWREVPSQTADPQLHVHNIVLATLRTKDGHIGSVDWSRLHQKVVGAVFHAAIATRARAHGAEIEIGEHGEARVKSIPEWVEKFHSRRATQGEEEARKYANDRGIVWDTLTGDERIELLREGSDRARQPKNKADRRAADEERSDFAVWQDDAKRAGYQHESPLRPEFQAPELTQEQRIELARSASMPLLSESFTTRSVLAGHELDEIAARGLIMAGLGGSPSADIAAVLRTFRERGVTINSRETELEWGFVHGPAGRPQVAVTTKLAVAEEQELVRLVRELAADRSLALTARRIDRAAERFLARHPKIDPAGAQWQAQRDLTHRIGEGARFSLSIGVGGSGKTSAVGAVLVEAWHSEGKTVYGMTVPWRASAALRDAGVDHAVAIDAFLKRVDDGKIKVDRNTVILADEVSMIGMRQQLALTKLAKETGAQLVEIGDPRQCQAVETPAIDTIAAALGDEAIPKLLTSIRQCSERERAIASMLREGRAVEAVNALNQDGRLHLVAGGPAPTIERTVGLWRQLADRNTTDPDYSLLVMTPTNEQAREVGIAIRTDRRQRGEIPAEDGIVLRAMDRNSKQRFDLPVSVGDRLRMFTRTTQC